MSEKVIRPLKLEITGAIFARQTLEECTYIEVDNGRFESLLFETRLPRISVH